MSKTISESIREDMNVIEGAPVDRDTALALIAKNLLHVDTLETRNSDRLDFHSLGVWSIRMALQAAYDAGRAATSEVK